MRILNLQVSKDKGIRIVENEQGGVDFIEFLVNDPSKEQLIITIPLNRRDLVADFIRFDVFVREQSDPKLTRG